MCDAQRGLFAPPSLFRRIAPFALGPGHLFAREMGGAVLGRSAGHF